VADRLVGYSCTIARNSGDNDRLFGSVSSKDVAAVLNDDGIDVQRRQIDMVRPIKQLGIYPVPVRLHADIASQIMVWVVSKA
jgi:large subunit ribosomal protein L9